jgi:hypothetical protein
MRFKRLLLGASTALIVLSCIGCSTTSNASNENNNMFTTIYADQKESVLRDNQTGVEYIVVQTSVDGVAITPRLNKDGKPIVSIHK